MSIICTEIRFLPVGGCWPWSSSRISACIYLFDFPRYLIKASRLKTIGLNFKIEKRDPWEGYIFLVFFYGTPGSHSSGGASVVGGACSRS